PRLSWKTKKGAPGGAPLVDLLRVLHSPRLAHHRDADLAGKAELRLDSLGDVSRHQLSGGIVDLFRLYQDPDPAAGLYRVRLLDAVEGVGYLLQLLQPLHVRLERFATGA